MPTNEDGSVTITWMSGVTYIHQETRVEGNALVFGCRINGGEFKPSVRIICDDPRDLAFMAVEATRVAAKR